MLFHYNAGTVLQLRLISLITTGPILFPCLFLIKSQYSEEPKGLSISFSVRKTDRRGGRWKSTAVLIRQGWICRPSPALKVLLYSCQNNTSEATFCTPPPPPKTGGRRNAAKELVTMEISENCYGNWSSAAHFV